MTTTETTKSNDAAEAKYRCVDCGRNLLTQNAWLTTPAGGLCLNCEASRATERRVAKILDRSYLGERWPDTFDEAGNPRPVEVEADGECDVCHEPIAKGDAKEFGDERLCPVCFIPAAQAYLAKRVSQ